MAVKDTKSKEETTKSQLNQILNPATRSFFKKNPELLDRFLIEQEQRKAEIERLDNERKIIAQGIDDQVSTLKKLQDVDTGGADLLLSNEELESATQELRGQYARLQEVTGQINKIQEGPSEAEQTQQAGGGMITVGKGENAIEFTTDQFIELQENPEDLFALTQDLQDRGADDTIQELANLIAPELQQKVLDQFNQQNAPTNVDPIQEEQVGQFNVLANIKKNIGAGLAGVAGAAAGQRNVKAIADQARSATAKRNAQGNAITGSLS